MSDSILADGTDPKIQNGRHNQLSTMMLKSCFHNLLRTAFVTLCFLSFIAGPVFSQSLDYEPKILLVTAHPDDDAIFSATVFKTTRLLNGEVDLAIVTNGEGGYRYSTLGNYLYGQELDKEETGRKYLPGIRKREVMAGGEIMGLRNYYFFDQVDDKSSLDAPPCGTPVWSGAG